MAMRSRSIFSGVFSRERPRTPASRFTCVSTAMPVTTPYPLPRMTFADFRPTPGMVVISSIVRGSVPWNLSFTIFAAARICRAFARKNPVSRMSRSNARGFART